MSKRQPPRTLQVLTKQVVTPNMLRVTLGGPGLVGFPEDQDGAYVKLILGGSDPSDPEKAKPLTRTYTIRHYDAQRKALDVDFVLHEIEGAGAEWARTCNVGDLVRVGGPGPKKIVDYSSDWFLLVGDMSALPAISTNIEGMPADGKGYALIEVIDESDRQELSVPEGLHIEWIVNPTPGEKNSVLMDAVTRVNWLPGRPAIWVAGEISQSLAIRNYLKSERGTTRDQMYVSSYWQIGETEDDHRISKKNTFSA